MSAYELAVDAMMAMLDRKGFTGDREGVLVQVGVIIDAALTLAGTDSEAWEQAETDLASMVIADYQL